MKINDTNLSFNNNYSLQNEDLINTIILHHSGVSVEQSVEVIHNYHKNTRGYAGIGYHFYVRKNGEIYKGRNINWVGAHAYKYNTNSIGICFEGDFDNEQMTDAQIKSGKELVKYLCEKYHISKNRILGHRDVCATSCPRK